MLTERLWTDINAKCKLTGKAPAVLHFVFFKGATVSHSDEWPQAMSVAEGCHISCSRF